VTRLIVVLLLLHSGALQAQEVVSFSTADKGTIEGDIYGGGPRGVILVAHGGYSFKARWEKQARALAQAGFRVLAFDTRAALEFKRTGNEPACMSDPACMAIDIVAAVRYLRLVGATSIAVVGGSAGGGAVAQASIDATPGDIDRIVLLAPMSIAEPEKMRGRKLFITARDDRNSSGLRLPGIRAQYEQVADPKEWAVVEGAGHGQLMFDAHEGDQVLREILRFLSAP
jgi:pimeloyl-ACP methyl ester carboxylesterase